MLAVNLDPVKIAESAIVRLFGSLGKRRSAVRAPG
jgi:hypothetical protein